MLTLVVTSVFPSGPSLPNMRVIFGDSFGYPPTGVQTTLAGSQVFQTSAASPETVSSGVVSYKFAVPSAVPVPLNFGEFLVTSEDMLTVYAIGVNSAIWSRLPGESFSLTLFFDTSKNPAGAFGSAATSASSPYLPFLGDVSALATVPAVSAVSGQGNIFVVRSPVAGASAIIAFASYANTSIANDFDSWELTNYTQVAAGVTQGTFGGNVELGTAVAPLSFTGEYIFETPDFTRAPTAVTVAGSVTRVSLPVPDLARTPAGTKYKLYQYTGVSTAAAAFFAQLSVTPGQLNSYASVPAGSILLSQGGPALQAPLDAGGNRIVNAGDAAGPLDLVNLRTLQGNLGLAGTLLDSISNEVSSLAAEVQSLASTTDSIALENLTINTRIDALSGVAPGSVSGTNTGDQIALTVPVTPTAEVPSTNVQAALQALATSKAPLLNPVFVGPITAPTFVGNLTGNASSANLAGSALRLTNQKNINGVPFDGLSDITIPSNNIPFSPAGALSSLTVRDALLELDAEKVRGDVFATAEDLNLVTVSGFYTLGPPGINWPAGGNGGSSLIVSNAGTLGFPQVSQIFIDTVTSDTHIRTRGPSGTFSPWQTVVYQGNPVFPGTVTAQTFVGNLTGSSDSSRVTENITGGAGGDIPYQAGTSVTALLPNGTNGQVLTSGGGTAPPRWSTVNGTGTVTSIAVAAQGTNAAALAVTGSPITGAGVIGLELNQFDAGSPGIVPPSGSDPRAFLRADGAWVGQGLTRIELTTVAATAEGGNDYWAENVGATVLTAPATAVDGMEFALTPANGLLTNSIDFGAGTVKGPAGSVTGVVTLNLGVSMRLKYSSNLAAWVVL